VVFPSRPESNIGGHLLTKADKELARTRLIGNGSDKPALKLDKNVFKTIFTTWHWYGFVALYIVFDQAVVLFTGPFGLYLKANAQTYSVSQINNIPTTQAAMAIISALIGAWWADASGNMWLPAAVIMSIT
jgi:ACS family pantothenate transporter-like MFS transporter